MPAPTPMFRGTLALLSNFYGATISVNGGRYATLEHAYQASKCCIPRDAAQIRDAPTPYTAKRLGRTVHLRADWERRKIPLMRQLLRAKFAQHPALAQQLLQTGNLELVERNGWHDTYWGTCYCPIHQGTGKNVLGQLLMELRAALTLTIITA